MTKRILALLLAVLLAVSCFALTACGGEEKPETDKPTGDAGTGDTTGDENNDPSGDEPTPPTAPSVVIYNDIVMVEDDAPQAADSWVYVSGEGELTVTYTSSNTAAFTVAEDGTITPVAPGEGKITVVAKANGLETTAEANVTIREIWNPTDPVSKEVVDIMRNKDLAQAPLSFWSVNFKGCEWDTREEQTDTQSGPVEIWGNHLQFLFVIPKDAEGGCIDATVGHKQDDLSEYHFSFQIYLREQNLEDDRTDYKRVEKRIQPWSIYDANPTVIYRCTFYDSGLIDLVEAGVAYDVVIVVYEDDTVVGWAANTMTWSDSCDLFVEAAENNTDVVK